MTGHSAGRKASAFAMANAQSSFGNNSTYSESNLRLLRIVVWLVTISAGFLQAWASRFVITPDGNSYLDVASTYLSGDYARAINGSLSPMFSWLIAAILQVFHPSGYWETPALHLLNLAGMLIALRCFEFFFIAFLALVKRSVPGNEEGLLTDGFWWLLGYGLFFSTSLFVLTMEPTTPDVWVCAASYLAVGLLLRISLGPLGGGPFAALGCVLGAAYLTKSFYFPLGFIFLVCAYFTGRRFRKNTSRVVLAFLAFLLVAGPFIVALSKSKQRFTFGDIGKIGFAMFVNPIPQVAFWHGENQSGIPKHPTREILTAPRVFEFAEPVAGSYPPGYDLSYWTEGITPHFNFSGLFRILRQSLGTCFLILLTQEEFAVGFLILLLCKERWRDSLVKTAAIWPVWLGPLVACLAYACVLTENRYIAPFLVFLWLGLFVGVLYPPSAASQRAVIAVVLGVVAFTGIKAAKYLVSDLAKVHRQENADWETAKGLQAVGIKPSDTISVIASKQEVHWARLAGVKIVAELPFGQDYLFWAADSSAKERVFAAFASTGSCVVVVKNPPPTARNEGWIQLGETDYYAYELQGEPDRRHSLPVHCRKD